MKKLFSIIIFCALCSTYGQHQDKVDFVHADVFVKPMSTTKSIIGDVVYNFKVKQRVDSIFLDAKNITFDKVLLNGKKVKFTVSDKRVTIYNRFKKGGSYELKIAYEAVPKQTVYFIGWDDQVAGNEQIWTQGQGKYTSHWLPSFDDMQEKLEFDLKIEADKKYTVVANGNLVKTTNETDNSRIWVFDMKQPMSSYLLAFAIGEYTAQNLVSSSGTPIYNYFYPKDSAKVEPTYRYTKRIFDFLENEIGVPYPWQNYKQIPVHDFLYAGMENTTATIFSDAYVVDSTSFIDRNYVKINAHEMAHQWFGNLVTEKDGGHHWLHEGFATYYAYLCEKQIFGEDYFYWELYRSAKELMELSKMGQGQSLLDPKANSLTFYEKGAWALIMLREEVGDEAFRKGVQNYLNKYRFKNVTIPNFLDEIKKVSNNDLDGFEETWLRGKDFPSEEVKRFLKSKNDSLKLYFEVQMKVDSTTVLGDEKLMWLWNRESPTPYKKQLLMNYLGQIPDTSLKKIFKNESSLEIRQSIALATTRVPPSLKNEYETLLLDDSYITKETMLYKLWMSFPENREVYLDKLKGVVGLPNKNVRLLWLTLALVTPEYDPNEKIDYLNELIGYTKPYYNTEIRQAAFQYLFEIRAVNNEVLKQLIMATNHHSWQFRSYARNLLDQQLVDVSMKNQIEKIAGQLKPSDLRYLKTKIELP
ncbi:M1 family metallopeptidase [Maribacter sp. MMG018]|uniref:M1 family metallopeptidase n=1 Tax=Maribacter sp. MMG018 TaxID=2822688 RepID=UPI001B396A00|nr:M1 family metallopeptidase [Maribacter sp. MMG018]MBQ4915386.1 M1 family metallopeptidase [Maribacter sp. MMG018]